MSGKVKQLNKSEDIESMDEQVPKVDNEFKASDSDNKLN
jgi:hypothetical protein